jgi:hypothetical protein
MSRCGIILLAGFSLVLGTIHSPDNSNTTKDKKSRHGYEPQRPMLPSNLYSIGTLLQGSLCIKKNA